MHVEQRAAQTILERGVRVEIPAPLLLRIFGKRNITIVLKQPSLGTLIRMSDLYLSTGIVKSQLTDIELESVMKLMSKHGKTFSRIIAIAYLNGYWRGKLLNGIVASMVLRLSPQKISAIISMLFVCSGAEDFMTTIRLVQSMKITEPNLSPESQGSQQEG